jgi:hypothetical protein
LCCLPQILPQTEIRLSDDSEWKRGLGILLFAPAAALRRSEVNRLRRKDVKIEHVRLVVSAKGR